MWTPHSDRLLDKQQPSEMFIFNFCLIIHLYTSVLFYRDKEGRPKAKETDRWQTTSVSSVEKTAIHESAFPDTADAILELSSRVRHHSLARLIGANHTMNLINTFNSFSLWDRAVFWYNNSLQKLYNYSFTISYILRLCCNADCLPRGGCESKKDFMFPQ